MTDSEDCSIDKIELILKHYPGSQDISLSTYQSDETSNLRCAEITAEIRELERLDKARNEQFDTTYDNCRSGAGCKTFYNLHVTQRQAWNASAQKSFKENRGDWILLDGGTRLSTDVICGEGNTRCEIDANDQLVTDANGNYIFKGDKDYRTYQSLKDDKKEFKPQIGATGGAQAEQGTLFGSEYKPGGLIDMNIEGFAGTHDLLGGQLPGYYGDDGNTKPGDKPFQGVVTGAAIPVAAPFALADLLSPDMIAILLQLSGN